MKRSALAPCYPIEYERAVRCMPAGYRVRWSWLRTDEARYLRQERQRARMARLYRAHLDGKAYFANSLESLIIAHTTKEKMQIETAWLTRYEKQRGKRGSK